MGEGKRNYQQCLGVPFLLYSSGDGKLFPCGAFFTEKNWDKYLMGDLTKDSFKDIIKSDRYWEVVERVRKMGVSKCYTACRTDQINSFLWKLKHPPEHVNFVTLLSGFRHIKYNIQKWEKLKTISIR